MIDVQAEEQSLSSQQVPPAGRRADPNRSVLTAQMSTGRLEAFSDGVFAIAITLLILNIHVPLENGQLPTPPSALVSRIIDDWPYYAAYVLSFVAVGISWIDHHTLFRYIERTDRVLLGLNILLLMQIAFIPFPTSLLAECLKQGRDVEVGVVVYSVPILLGAIILNLLWLYASRGHRLIISSLPTAAVNGITRRNLTWPLFYVASTVFAFVNIGVSLVILVLVPLAFFLPDPTRLFSRK